MKFALEDEMAMVGPIMAGQDVEQAMGGRVNVADLESSYQFPNIEREKKIAAGRQA